jgi:hypothetical protein
VEQDARTQKHLRGSSDADATLSRRLSLYAMAAGAGVALASHPAGAQSSIVYHAADLVLPGGVTKIDLNNDGVVDMILSLQGYASGYDSAQRLYQRPAAGDAALLSPRLAGAVIGAQDDFQGGRALMASVFRTCKTSCRPPLFRGPWVAKDAFLGVKFLINSETHFGWVRLSVTAGRDVSSFSATITGYAYNTVANQGVITGVPGAPVSGAVVHPASLGALSLGARGLAVWRRELAVAGEQAQWSRGRNPKRRNRSSALHNHPLHHQVLVAPSSLLKTGGSSLLGSP